MRAYSCAACGADVDFAAPRCVACNTPLGYRPSEDDVVALQATGPALFSLLAGDVDSDSETYWRCLNAAWGCNWILPAHQGDTWCRSCRLTRGRPDNANPDAVAAWAGAEVAKRLLVRQLLLLGLPVERSAPDADDGIVFDLVHLPDSVGLTGHRPGVITLDLREVDDEYRDRMRIHLGETDRTVLGHLRHEIGHHYWRTLVDNPGAIGSFRDLFGDERTDYRAALSAHYERPVGPPPPTHVSHYATAHPSEDWAEVFCHYLAMRDGLETGVAFDVLPVSFAAETAIDTMIDTWRHLSRAVNQLDVGLGHPPSYPHTITAAVGAKLAYVHRLVTG